MKIIFFTGKGGVGKSTMSAASAWQLSRQNKVLIVSLDPAHNLGDIFGVNLKHSKKKISDSLYLQEVDIKRLSREYLKKEIDVLTTTYKYLQTINLDNLFSVLRYSPGIEEYALLTGIESTIREETDFDYIIFDTPPTGLTLRFLALPRITITWIERLTEIRRQILEKRYTIFRLRGQMDDSETVLNYSEKEDNVLNRLQKMEKNYKNLSSVLEGEDCSIVLVYNPDILSLRESERLIEGLHDLSLPLRLLINNKNSARNEKMADIVDEKMKELASGVPVRRISIAESLLDGSNTKLYDIDQDIVSSLP